MILAIDYDNTYSAHPEEFEKVRELFQAKGAEVFIVTARNKKLDPITDDLSKFDRVFYTSGRAKAGEVRADIWIDDSPVTLCCNFIPGEAHAEPGKALHQGYKDNHILWNWEEGRFVSYISKKFTPYHKNKVEKDA